MPCRIFTYLTEILQSQIIVLTNWRAFLDCVYCFFLQQNKPCSISALTFFTCRNRCNWKLSDMALATGALTMHWVAIAFRVWIVERCTENDVCAVGAVDIAWAVWQAICHRTRRVLGLVIGHKISIKLRGRERERVACVVEAMFCLDDERSVATLQKIEKLGVCQCNRF